MSVTFEFQVHCGMQCDTECNILDYTFPLYNPERLNMYSAQLNGRAFLRLRDFV